jgi:prefoldin subunit 5
MPKTTIAELEDQMDTLAQQVAAVNRRLDAIEEFVEKVSRVLSVEIEARS